MSDKKSFIYKEKRFSLENTLISSFGNDECYVFQLCRNSDNTKFATANSNNQIKIYDGNTYNIVTQLNGHIDTINEIRFATTHTDVLFSCSSDGTLKIWDTRSGQCGPTYKGTGEFFSFDVDSSETTLASGAKTSIFLWDLRTTKLIRKLDDFHSDDITQIRFHSDGTLITGSMDGNICMFDLKIQEEDDVLVTGINLEDSISKIEFHGDKKQYISCLTHSERLSIWQLDGTRLKFYDSIREQLSTSDFSVQYCIDTYYDPLLAKSFLAVGNHEGQFGFVDLGKEDLKMECVVTGGHNGTIRSIDIDYLNDRIFTCGEDSRICIWTNTENNIVTENNRKASSNIRSEFLSTHDKKPY